MQLPPLSSLMNGTRTDGSLYEDMMGFYHAVDWSEPWLRAVGLFHVLVWAYIICTRRFTEVQMVLLFVVRAQLLPSRACLSCVERSCAPLAQLARSTWPSGSTGRPERTGRSLRARTTLTSVVCSSR